MPASRNAAPSPPGPDGDGVRVTRIATSRRDRLRGVALLAIVAAILGVAWWIDARTTPAASVASVGAESEVVASVESAAAVSAVTSPATSMRMHDPRTPTPSSARAAPAPEIGPDDLPSDDPNDLAAYISPEDPEPTMGEVIQALHDLGDHTGIGAFNPPGTSPPLRGLAVPPEFVLPPGYVRHHQVTDEGEPLEPILMYSPDAVLRDADGNVVPMPEDRVVPPHLAPPGLVIREIDIPPIP